MAEIEKLNRRKLPTGIQQIDAYLKGGITDQSINVIGGALASGKTTLGVIIANNMVSNGLKVLHIVREDYTSNIALKYVAAQTGTPQHGFKPTIRNVRVGNILVTHINFDDSVSKAVRTILEGEQFDFIIIENIDTPSSLEINRLRSLLETYNVTILGTAQANRPLMDSALIDFKRPTISGADLVLTIEKLYEGHEYKNINLNILKHRYESDLGFPSAFELNIDFSGVKID